METKKKRKLKPFTIICIILLLITGISFAIYHFVFSNTSEETPPPNVATVTNKIEGYEYTLDDRDTKIFQENFKKLKENLENEQINMDEYVESISKLFIIDLFTIDNKVSKYDIGGLDYLYDGAKESFRSKILDTIYKNVEDNSYKNRKQSLPIVENITNISKEQTSYKINETEYDAYFVTIAWDYQSDLGYDKNAKLTIIKEENKLSIIAYEPIK